MNPLQIPLQVRRQLLGEDIWSERDDQEPLDGLLRAIQSAPQLLPTFAASVLLLLEDDELTLRSGAVGALPAVGQAIGAERLCDVLDRSMHLFRGVAPRGATVLYPDLEKALLASIARHAKPDQERALARLRAAARADAWGARLLPDLARLDPEWVVGNAKEVVPPAFVSVLLPMNAEQRLRLVDSLAPYPPELRDTLGPPFWGQFPQDEALKLQRHMWPE